MQRSTSMLGARGGASYTSGVLAILVELAATLRLRLQSLRP